MGIAAFPQGINFSVSFFSMINDFLAKLISFFQNSTRGHHKEEARAFKDIEKGANGGTKARGEIAVGEQFGGRCQSLKVTNIRPR
jgi:hypothetical protein